MHQPTTTHWIDVKGILRYLKHTHNHDLFYQSGSLKLEAYSDADYAGHPDDHHSTGGYCVYLCLNPISWSAKKHHIGSRSSTVAEHQQLAYTAAELSWIWSLFKDLGISLSTPLILCDNISSISKTKHLEVNYHYVCDKVVYKEFDICYISTTNQIADIFTKHVSSSRFHLLTTKLMVRSCPISLQGCDNHKIYESESKSISASYDSKSNSITAQKRPPNNSLILSKSSIL